MAILSLITEAASAVNNANKQSEYEKQTNKQALENKNIQQENVDRTMQLAKADALARVLKQSAYNRTPESSRAENTHVIDQPDLSGSKVLGGVLNAAGQSGLPDYLSGKLDAFGNLLKKTPPPSWQNTDQSPDASSDIQPA
jgi:hypothetical protein